MPFPKLPIAAAIVATLAAPAATADSSKPLGETATLAFRREIPNIPGKSLASVVVTYAPGARSAPHRHARSAFIYAYVLSGTIRSQADDGPVEIYHAGESWFEPPGARHKISENASSAEPARLLAVFVMDTGEHVLTTPEEN